MRSTRRRSNGRSPGSFVYGLSALFYGECTVKDGRIEQTNFDSYNSMRIDEMPKVEDDRHAVGRFLGRRRRADDLRRGTGGAQCDLRRDRQAHSFGPAADHDIRSHDDDTRRPAAASREHGAAASRSRRLHLKSHWWPPLVAKPLNAAQFCDVARGQACSGTGNLISQTPTFHTRIEIKLASRQRTRRNRGVVAASNRRPSSIAAHGRNAMAALNVNGTTHRGRRRPRHAAAVGAARDRSA